MNSTYLKVFVQRRHLKYLLSNKPMVSLCLHRALHIGDHSSLERLRNYFCMKDNSVKLTMMFRPRLHNYMGDCVSHSTKWPNCQTLCLCVQMPIQN